MVIGQEIITGNQEDCMEQNHSWDEHQSKQIHKEREIDIRPCNCGSVHLTFFGQMTFHLSRQEFIKFSRGVVRVTNHLKPLSLEDRFPLLKTNRFSH
jgi:hypothetical protein